MLYDDLYRLHTVPFRSLVLSLACDYLFHNQNELVHLLKFSNRHKLLCIRIIEPYHFTGTDNLLRISQILIG
jgi:hypothetical protein